MSAHSKAPGVLVVCHETSTDTLVHRGRQVAYPRTQFARRAPTWPGGCFEGLHGRFRCRHSTTISPWVMFLPFTQTCKGRTNPFGSSFLPANIRPPPLLVNSGEPWGASAIQNAPKQAVGAAPCAPHDLLRLLFFLLGWLKEVMISPINDGLATA